MADFPITDNIEFSGEWFVPVEQGALANKVHGNLKWADRKGRLQLLNSFSNPNSGLASRAADRPVIHGETTNSKLITMLDAFSSGRSMAMGEAGFKAQESFQSTQCLVGAHVDEKTTYSLIYYRIPGLQLWLGNKGASLEINLQTADVINYRFESLVKERFEFPDKGLCIELHIGRNLPFGLGATVTIKSDGALKVVPDSPQTLDWFYREAGKVVLRSQTLDHLRPEFSASEPFGGLDAPSGLCSKIGVIWPIPLCGLSSL